MDEQLQQTYKDWILDPLVDMQKICNYPIDRENKGRLQSKLELVISNSKYFISSQLEESKKILELFLTLVEPYLNTINNIIRGSLEEEERREIQFLCFQVRYLLEQEVFKDIRHVPF